MLNVTLTGSKFLKIKHVTNTFVKGTYDFSYEILKLKSYEKL